MSAAKHTPGPWRADDGGRSIVAGEDDEKWIATIKLDLGVKTIAERNANAKLIAAAPALADALDGVVKFVRHDDECASLAYVAEVNDVKGFECDCGAAKAQDAAGAALRAAGRLP